MDFIMDRFTSNGLSQQIVKLLWVGYRLSLTELSPIVKHSPKNQDVSTKTVRQQT